MQDRRTATSSPGKKPEGGPVCTVSPAAGADAPTLAELHAEAFQPGWSATELAAYCNAPNSALLKATADGVILGLVVLQFAAGEAEILSIAVRKDSRQSGVGSSLLAGAISFCEEMRVSHLYLEVAEANHPALTLYKKFGFQIFGVRKNYYLNEAEQSHNAFVMRLTIGAGRGKR